MSFVLSGLLKEGIMATIDLPYELLGVATVLFFIYLAQSAQDLFIKDARGRPKPSDRSAGPQTSAEKPMLVRVEYVKSPYLIIDL